MTSDPVCFSNEMRFRFIGHVLCKDDDYTHPSNLELAKKCAVEFGFSLDYVDPEKFDPVEAYTAFNESREAFEKYLHDCDRRKYPALRLKKADLKLTAR